MQSPEGSCAGLPMDEGDAGGNDSPEEAMIGHKLAILLEELANPSSTSQDRDSRIIGYRYDTRAPRRRKR